MIGEEDGLAERWEVSWSILAIREIPPLQTNWNVTILQVVH
jgi:hypothetical protein